MMRRGRSWAYVAELLREAGAREVHWLPIFTKKGRPAYQLQVICVPEDVAHMESVIFCETPTLGVRRVPMERTVLKRRRLTVETPYGSIRCKVAELPDARRASPPSTRIAVPPRARLVPPCARSWLPRVEPCPDKMDNRLKRKTSSHVHFLGRGMSFAHIMNSCVKMRTHCPIGYPEGLLCSCHQVRSRRSGKSLA